MAGGGRWKFFLFFLILLIFDVSVFFVFFFGVCVFHLFNVYFFKKKCNIFMVCRLLFSQWFQPY